MGFLSSLTSMATTGLSGIGSSINNMTGATSSAAQAQRYAVANAKLNNKFQKEFAQNAHQWEMADLKAAGLNPALTATGGNGASASGGGSFGGSTGTPAGNPFDILNSIVGMQNQTSATKSQNAVNYAAAIKSITEADWIPYKMRIEMLNALSGQEQAAAATTNAEANTINADSNKEVNTEKTKNLRRERGYIGFFPHTSASGYTEYKFYNPKNTKQYLIQGKY